MNQDLTIGQRVLRSAGLTVLLMTGLACGLLALTFVDRRPVRRLAAAVRRGLAPRAQPSPR